MKKTYPRIMRMLVRSGHHPAKALEIVLDAARCDKHARQWIGIMFSHRRGK